MIQGQSHLKHVCVCVCVWEGFPSVLKAAVLLHSFVPAMQTYRQTDRRAPTAGVCSRPPEVSAA